jgi:micrococcal nuclease
VKFLLYPILFLFPIASFAQLTGKVVSIADGDTFTMVVNKQQIKIRLHGIDCPEKGQDFSQAAKEFLSDYVFDKVVSVRTKSKDRYRRVIGIVTVDGKNVNEKLLEAGLAWHYKKYDKNPAWAQLEEIARKNKRGLWAHPSAVPPWEWRKRKH